MHAVHHSSGISKTFMAYDWPGLVEDLSGHLTTLFERGGIKQAASDLFSRKELDENAPPPGYFMIHQTVMGSEEGYGYNNNHDSYPDATLKKYHPTFVTHGRVYREHRNRDPKHAIGVIKAARYSEKMQRVELLKHLEIAKAEKEFEMAKAGKELHASMACFPAGTKVRMWNWTEKAIEDICCGDRVLTHKGNCGVVSHTMKRDYADTGIAIRVYGLPEEVICTQDHGVWARPALAHSDPCPVCGEVFTSLRAHLWQKKDSKHAAAYRDYARYCEGFRPAGSLKRADYLRTAVSQVTATDGEVWQARLLGLYMAEGSLYLANLNKPNYVGQGHPRSDFTFHIKERDLQLEVMNHILSFTGSPAYLRDRPAGNSAFVRSTNRKLFDWLLQHGGKGAEHKRLSAEVMQWSPATQKHILEAWLEGDGSWHKTNEFISGTTVSRTLAIQMMEIAARCGLNANLQSFQSKTKDRLRSYQVVFSSQVCGALNVSKIPAGWEVCKEHKTSYGHLKHQADTAVLRKPAARPLSFVEGGFIYRRIAKLRRVFLNETVYDLTVPGDHGFQVGVGIGVSNCRVPYDVCSCCENQAKYASLYCTHLKDHMGQWLPNFKKYAFARNPICTFFDSSVVENPAAREAKHIEYRFGPDLLKAASTARPVFSGAQWAEFEGVDLSQKLTMDPYETQLLQKLAALEGSSTPDRYRDTVSRFAFADAHDVQDHEWEAVRGIYAGTLFNKLARRRVLLPFDLFSAYATGRKPSELRSDPDFTKAASMLPSVFRALATALEQGGCGCDQGDMDMFRAAPTSHAAFDPGQSDVIDRVMDKASENFGAEPEPLKRRALVVISIKKASTPNSVLPAVSPTSLPPLLTLYGLYKVAAIRDALQFTSGNRADVEHELIRCGVDQHPTALYV